MTDYPTTDLVPLEVTQLMGHNIYIVESPVDAPRSLVEYYLALGRITIAGRAVDRITGIEWHALNSPVRVGERIGLRVVFADGQP